MQQNLAREISKHHKVQSNGGNDKGEPVSVQFTPAEEKPGDANQLPLAGQKR